jgi:RNA polymerase sigma-70 factor (ECF subfamily)
MRTSDTKATSDTQATSTTSSASGAHARAGRLDQDTLAELWRMHGAFLLRALSRVTGGDQGRAEDVLQETLLRAWQNPDAIPLRIEQSRPWLLTVARRIAIDHIRRQAARAQEVPSEGLADHSSIEDPYDDLLADLDLELAFAELSPQHREVLTELYLNGRSVAGTADVLGIPQGTVKSRNYYAIRAIRPVLERRGLMPAA